MTICITAITGGGSSLLYASDTMITSGMLSLQFEHPRKKVTELSNTCIALTAGDALAHTELFARALGEIHRLRDPSVHEIVETVKNCYQVIREKEINERVLLPRGFDGFQEFYLAHKVLVPEIAMGIQNAIEKYNYGLDIIVAGISDGIAHIFGVNDPGTSQSFDAIGFHAIGSGLPHAINSLIARGYHQDVDLAEGLLMVYEAKKMAEKAPGVGSNRTDIGILDKRGVFHINSNEFQKLDIGYNNWIMRNDQWKDDIKSVLKKSGVIK